MENDILLMSFANYCSTFLKPEIYNQIVALRDKKVQEYITPKKPSGFIIKRKP